MSEHLTLPPYLFLLLLLLLLPLLGAGASTDDDISVRSVSQCTGGAGKGTYRVVSATCGGCNWGEVATLTGTVNVESCSDVCVVGTAHTAGPAMTDGWVVFRREDYDCGDDLVTEVRIPPVPSYLTGVASGRVVVEFFEGGCDGPLVGCSVVAVSSAMADVVRFTGGALLLLGVLGLAGTAAYRRHSRNKRGGDATGPLLVRQAGKGEDGAHFGFSRMEGGGGGPSVSEGHAVPQRTHRSWGFARTGHETR
jgi:hypothetical protein